MAPPRMHFGIRRRRTPTHHNERGTHISGGPDTLGKQRSANARPTREETSQNAPHPHQPPPKPNEKRRRCYEVRTACAPRATIRRRQGVVAFCSFSDGSRRGGCFVAGDPPDEAKRKGRKEKGGKRKEREGGKKRKERKKEKEKRFFI